MSAGDGYRYFMRSIAAGDGAREASTPLTRYYTESGNPPGRWVGAGLAGVDGGNGLAAGAVVTEEQMFRLFGMGSDPVSGEQLGARPYRFDATTGRGSVAGFDLTFSVPKSVSAWWALADGPTQTLIYQAHTAAIASCLRLLEEQVAATRIGKNGVAQAEVRGLLAAGFDHWDSRAGDPHLHTHVVIANRAQGLDGTWRTLDSRALYRAVVAISETHQGLLADEISRRLEAAWGQHPRRHSAVPAWEIDGVPAELIDAFSQRSHAIEDAKNELVAAFRDRRGREPSSTEVLRLRQRATLSTRPDKDIHSLAELTEQWHERADLVLGMDAQAWAKGVNADTNNHWLQADDLSLEQLTALASTVRNVVQGKRSTWGRWNLHAEAARQLMGHRFATDTDRLTTLTRIVDLAIEDSVLLTPPRMTPTPAALLRRDGTSMFAFRNCEQYTSRTLLDAETRLLEASHRLTGPKLLTADVETVLAAPPPGFRYRLGKDQGSAIRQIATSGHVVDVLVGPAGTGKTVTLAAMRAAWQNRHGPGSVIGLAPSATAADVLAAELGIGTENTAKWLIEADQEPARLQEIDRCDTLLNRIGRRNARLTATVAQRRHDLHAKVDQWRLHPGQLVILDEASLAGTLTLDRITAQARTAGAKVLLVGDWAQLGAIEAGGAFAMLVADREPAPELGAIRRFTAPWEREASRRLRLGDHDAISDYQTHGRVQDGDSNAMLDAAYQGWCRDEQAGTHSLLLAADSATVTALNTRARADLVASGQVETAGIPLNDGTLAGRGDRIITRKNERRLSTGRGFVKNGDRWNVTARHRDGTLTVQRPSGGTRLRLAADYVAEHVDLAYATSAYRAQGATVTTAHAVITGRSLTREALYVAMTRGRHANTVYVATDAASDDCEELQPDQPMTGRDVLTRVLDNVGADVAAHDVARAEQHTATSISQLVAEYETIAALAQRPRWRQLLTGSGLTESQVDAIEGSVSGGALTAAMRRAEALGLPLEYGMRELVTNRSLDDAQDIAAVLHERVTHWTNMAAFSPGQHQMILGLIPAANVDDDTNRHALHERAAAIEQCAQTLVEQALLRPGSWIHQLGTPPADPSRREQWMRAARTVAAHRDLNDQPAPEHVVDPDRLRDDSAIAARAIREARSTAANSEQARPELNSSAPTSTPLQR